MLALLFLVFVLTGVEVQSAKAIAPPVPARIGGNVTIDGVQLTKKTAEGFKFVVTRQDGIAYSPVAEDKNGLNASNWYVIDIPLHNERNQPQGARQGDTVVIHVFKDGSELLVTSPSKGRFKVGSGGSTTRIDLMAVTDSKK